MRERRPSAIRRSHNKSNVIGERVKVARHLHVPVMTHQLISERATRLSGYRMTRDAVARIEYQQRSVYDFEVIALALALGVDVKFLLGLTEDPGDLTLEPVPAPNTPQ